MGEETGVLLWCECVCFVGRDARKDRCCTQHSIRRGLFCFFPSFLHLTVESLSKALQDPSTSITSHSPQSPHQPPVSRTITSNNYHRFNF